MAIQTYQWRWSNSNSNKNFECKWREFNGIVADSQPIDLVPVLTGSTVTSYKKDFTFVAGSDQTEDASFEYVIVDPVTNANSKVSTASIAINPVNDKPELSGVVSDRLFTENDDALILDRSAAIRDIDSIGLSLATIELSNTKQRWTYLFENFGDKTTSVVFYLLVKQLNLLRHRQFLNRL